MPFFKITKKLPARSVVPKQSSEVKKTKVIIKGKQGSSSSQTLQNHNDGIDAGIDISVVESSSTDIASADIDISVVESSSTDIASADIDISVVESSSTACETEVTLKCETVSCLEKNLLTNVEVYKLEIVKAGGYHSVYSDRSCVILPDFVEERSDLNFTKLFVSHEHTFTLDGECCGVQIIKCCSCDEDRKKFINSLPSTLSTPIHNLDKCIHLKVIKLMEPDIVEAFLQDCLTENEEEQEQEQRDISLVSNLNFDSSKLVVVSNDSVGVVGYDFAGIKCYVCNSPYCAHVSLIKEFDVTDASTPQCVQELFELRIQDTKTKVCRKSIAISINSIPFHVTDIYRIYLNRQLAKKTINGKEMFFVVGKSFQDQECCVHSDGHSVDTNSNWKSYKVKDLILRDRLCKVAVASISCMRDGCFSNSFYDGLEDGILNMETFCVHHLVLRDYLQHFLFGNGVTLIGYYKVWKKNFTDVFGNLPLCSFNYDNWRLAWYTFINLLDLDMSKGFSCSLCGSSPDIVVCDATSLGFQRKFAHLVFNNKKDPSGVINRRCDFKKRIAIDSVAVRKNLLSWCHAKCKCVNKLTADLASYHEIHEAFLWTKSTFPDKLPSGVITMFKCLSSSSPVCSYLPPNESAYSLAESLFHADIKSKSNELLMIYNKLPIFYDLLLAIPGPRLPLEWKPLIYKLISLSREPFLSQPVTSTTDTLFEPPLSFFPSLPMLRNRGNYSMDKQQDQRSCSKKYTSHKNLTAGIFTVYCHHGICYGFQAMESAESVDVPFSIYRTRFAKAPSVIIYDNACSLHAYCLNRDPLFFKDSLFLVDRFHWFNHTGCADSYDIRRYPLLRKVNSEVNEQQNAATKKLKTQLSYMTPVNFQNHCVLFLWHRNLMKAEKMKQRTLTLV